MISETTRLKMSQSKIGYVVPDYVKEKIRKSLLGRKLSEETKLKIKNSVIKSGNKPPIMRGASHPGWKGGVSLNKHRFDVPYKNWRTSVFLRDNYTCVHCGIRSKKGTHVRLEADHIRPWAFYKELRYEISNGRTLCVPCHKKTPTYKAKVDKSYLGVG